jgi:hypothetical protein
MWIARAAVGLAVVSVGAGTLACGAAPPDLFAVDRAGNIPGAKFELVVADNGTARCNGRSVPSIGESRLLEARDIQRELKGAAKRHVSLPPGPSSVLRYRVQSQDGTVRFSDTSPGVQPVFLRVAALTRAVAKQVCGLPR